MTRITLQDGKIVLRDWNVGTEQACCCNECSGICFEDGDCAPGCACNGFGLEIAYYLFDDNFNRIPPTSCVAGYTLTGVGEDATCNKTQPPEYDLCDDAADAMRAELEPLLGSQGVDWDDAGFCYSVCGPENPLP
jgi:hypothetical protein